MRDIRILEIAHDHPDWTPGGTEIVAHDLARALDMRPGTAARFLAVSTSLQRPEADAGSLQAMGNDFILHTAGYDRFSMLRQDGVSWIDALARVLGTVRPDIVHLHGLDRIGAEAIPVIRRLAPGARIVLTLHDYQLICPNEGLLLTTRDAMRCGGFDPDSCRTCFPEISAARHSLRQRHLLALIETVDVLIAPSAFLRARFIAWGLEASRIRIIPNAVIAKPDHGGDLSDVPMGVVRNRFAFFGNVARHKGALVLLEAAARLKHAGIDLRIDIHGGLGRADAIFRSEFAAKLQAAEPIVQHRGPYPRGDVVALMRAADWIVVPSIWWENAPLVILEARAAGRPVICSGIGGMAEHVESGVNGLHVAPGDAAALAETMRQAAADPECWEHLAANSACATDHGVFVDQHLRLFRRLLAKAAA